MDPYAEMKLLNEKGGRLGKETSQHKADNLARKEFYKVIGRGLTRKQLAQLEENNYYERVVAGEFLEKMRGIDYEEVLKTLTDKEKLALGRGEVITKGQTNIFSPTAKDEYERKKY